MSTSLRPLLALFFVFMLAEAFPKKNHGACFEAGSAPGKSPYPFRLLSPNEALSKPMSRQFVPLFRANEVPRGRLLGLHYPTQEWNH